MYMLIGVVDGNIYTNIYNSLAKTQEMMKEDSETRLEIEGYTDEEIEEQKGDNWDTGKLYGYIDGELTGTDVGYKIVELPSLVCELI